MKVTTESSSPTEIILNIALDAADEEPFIDRSYRRTVGNLAIPGFRKGKAPRSIVESHVGRPALLREALDYMIPETLNRVMQERELRAFIEPQVEMLEWEPVAYKATIPLEPTVDLGDYRQLRLEKPPVAVTDEQVERVIERFRREAAPWEPVARPAQFGDLLTVDVRGVMDGEEIINDSAVDFIPQPDSVLPFPGFTRHLEGLTEGESREFMLTIPEDYPRPEFAGREVAFATRAIAIKEKNLPAADDEFAKGVGDGFESIAALRENVAAQLSATFTAQSDYAFQGRVMDAVLEQSYIDLSDLVIDREVQAMLEEQDRALRNQRLDLATYLSYVGQTREELQEELRPDAVARLRRTLAMRQLVKEEGIAVTPEEVQAEMEELLADTPEENLAATRRDLNSEDNQATIYNALLSRKTMQRLTAIVQGLDDPETAAADSDPDGETETDAAAESEPAAETETAAVTAADSAPESETETDPAGAMAPAAELTAEPAAAAIAESDPADATAPETQGTDEGAKPDAD